jgi:predicted Zn-dependent protease
MKLLLKEDAMRATHGRSSILALLFLLAVAAGCDTFKSMTKPGEPESKQAGQTESLKPPQTGAIPAVPAGATDAATASPGVKNAAIDKLGDAFCTFFLKVNKDKKVSADSDEAKAVQQVADKLIAAAKQSAEYGDAAKGINWRVQVLNEKTANAYACPGGQIVVYTGILRPARNEAGLAAVLGHEMTHAMARDTNPPLGATTIASATAIAAEIVAVKSTKELKPETAAVVGALGFGAVVSVSTYFSRQQELNADRQGMLMMALAGYDPKEYEGFLDRLISCEKKGIVPEFLSSHPEPKTRHDEIKKSAELMKQAEGLYSKGHQAGAGTILSAEQC